MTGERPLRRLYMLHMGDTLAAATGKVLENW
jgi:hypothetical protein